MRDVRGGREVRWRSRATGRKGSSMYDDERRGEERREEVAIEGEEKKE